MKKTWLNNYPEGVPADVDVNEFQSIAHYFDVCCEQFADQTAFVNMGTEISYDQLHQDVEKFAAHLQALGVVKGDRVAIMMPNVLQYPVVLFAVLRLGAIVVNVNPLYTARELEHVLKDSNAVMLVAVTNFAFTIQKVINSEGVNVEHLILTDLGDRLKFPKNYLVNFVVKHIKKVVPKYSLPQAIAFNDLMKTSVDKPLETLALNHDDVAFLQYTGGTTGVAKGAVLTHGNMVANVLQTSAWMQPNIELGKEVVITALPLYHIFALMANCLLFMKFGAKNVLITNPRDIGGFVKELAKYSFTAMTGVNTLFNALTDHPDFKKLNFDSMKLSLGGGMPVQEAVAKKWQKITGKVLLQGYGLTEASPVVSIGRFDATNFQANAGVPIPSTEIKFVDDAGHDVAEGEKGELAVRGPQVMRGYWGEHMQQETDNVITEDGWLLTGDYGFLDDSGSIVLKERKKDLILVSGFNVYPTEVEDVLMHCPGVSEAAVIGVSDEKTFEKVKAFIVRKDPRLSRQAVLRFCKNQLTRYKVPKEIVFRDELPKTNVGKILRRALR